MNRPLVQHRTATRSPIGLVVVLAGLSAFGPLCMDMYLPSLPELPGSLGSTAGAAQLSLSACIIGLGVGQLIVGPLSDRLGRRMPLLIGLAAFALTSAGCALTDSMTLLIGIRFLQGCAGAAGIVLCRAIVADRFTGKAAAAYFSTIAAINGLAPILAPIIGGQILHLGTWRLVFWTLTGIGLVLLALSMLLIDESLPPQNRTNEGLTSTFAAFRVLTADRVYVGYVMAGSLVCAAMFGYISASPFLLQTGFGLSPQEFSFCFGANALGIVLMSQLGRMLLNRASSEALLRWGVGQCLVGAIGLTAVLLVGAPLPAVLVALFVMVSAVGFALPYSSVLAMDRHRGIAGAASALFGTTQYVLGAITAPLVGIGDRALGHAVGFTALGAAVAALAGLGLAGWGTAPRAAL